MSATGIEARIWQALVTRLESLVLSPELPIAFPGVEFDKPESGYWLEAAFLPAQSAAVSLSGWNEYTGVLQIVLVTSSTQTAEVVRQNIVSSIVAHFKRGTVLTEGDQEVRIVQPPYASPSFADPQTPTLTRTPVTVPYWSSAKQES